MATPHHGLHPNALKLLPEGESLPGPSHFVINLINSDLLQDITDQFVPLMRRFRIFNFWEQVKTVIAEISTYIVDEASAAPLDDDTERCGILRTHSGMTKFSSTADAGYPVVLATLERYLQQAPRTIESRWKSDREQLRLERREQADALYEESRRLQKRAGTQMSSPVVQQENVRLLQRIGSEISSPTTINVHNLTRARAPVEFFTGRSWHAQYMVECFGPIQARDSKATPKIFVVHGLGGSGKTEICKKFAFDNKQR